MYLHNDNDMYGSQIVAIYSGDVPPNNEMISESSYVIDLRWEQFIIAEIRTCVRAGPPVSQRAAGRRAQRRIRRERARDRRAANDVVFPMHIIISCSPPTIPERLSVFKSPEKLPASQSLHTNIQATPLKKGSEPPPQFRRLSPALPR